MNPVLAAELVDLGAKLVERLVDLYQDGTSRTRIDRGKLLNRREELRIIRVALKAKAEGKI